MISCCNPCKKKIFVKDKLRQRDNYELNDMLTFINFPIPKDIDLESILK